MGIYIFDLPLATTLNAGDYFPISNTGVTKKIAFSSISGLFYPASNPNGFITSIPIDVVRTSGNQTINGDKTFAGRIIATAFPPIFTTVASTGNAEIDFDGCTLYDNAQGNKGLDWDSRILYDGGETPSVDWLNRTLRDNANTVVFDWANSYSLNDSAGTPSVNFDDRSLPDANGFTSVNYKFRILQNTGGLVTVDYGNRILSGNWNLGPATGIFLTSGQSGLFYPRSNPSGYLSSIPTDVVRTSGNQTISGSKTFANSGVLSGQWQTNTIPSGANDLVNKGYADAHYGGQSSTGPAFIGIKNANFTPTIASGAYQLVGINANLTMAAPSGSVDGFKLKMRVVGYSSCNFSLDGAIRIPSDSSFTSPRSLDVNNTYFMQMEYVSGMGWLLQSFIGGYS